MPTAAEFGDVILDGLAAMFRAIGRFFVYLKYTGNNETLVDPSRGDYQSFWEIMYHSNTIITWFRKMLFDTYGFIWQINNNNTLENEFANVVTIVANNSTTILGEVSGDYGVTFLIRTMIERVPDNPEFTLNFWYAIKHAVVLSAEALKVFPSYFP